MKYLVITSIVATGVATASLACAAAFAVDGKRDQAATLGAVTVAASVAAGQCLIQIHRIEKETING